MSRLLLDKEFAIDNHFHGLDVPKISEFKLGEDNIHMINIVPGTMLLMCLNSNNELIIGLSVNGEVRSLSFNEMNSRNSRHTVQYYERNKSVKLYCEEHSTKNTPILKSSNPDEQKSLVNYKVTEKDLVKLEAAMFNNPRIKELIEFFIQQIDKIDPEIKKFLFLDKRFLRMLKLKSKPVDDISEAVIDYYFLESGILSDGIDIPEEIIKK